MGSYHLWKKVVRLEINLKNRTYSTVTDFARFLGWSTSQPLSKAM